MKETLSKRIFLITFIFLVCFMALTLLFQTFIFEDFYQQKKTKSLSNQIEEFSKKNSFKMNNPIVTKHQRLVLLKPYLDGFTLLQ